MHKNSFYISFGVWIVILPFLGVPGAWRNTLVFISGLFLILVSVGPVILKKLQTRSKPKKRQNKNVSNSYQPDIQTESSAPTNSQVKSETETEK